MTNSRRYSDEIEQFVSYWSNGGFENLHDELCEMVLPGVSYTGELSEDDSIPIGGSKLGGRPDLIDPTMWPRANSGDYLRFRVQLNLSEVAELGVVGELPESGLLSFFYDTEFEDGNRDYYVWGGDLSEVDQWKVVYQEDLSTLHRVDFPYQIPPFVRGGMAKLVPHRVLTMPDSESILINQLIPDYKDRWKFTKQSWTADHITYPQFELARLLGHPKFIQGDLQLTSYYFLHGKQFYPRIPDPEFERSACESRFLFQLNAWYETADADFPGEGSIYFSILKQDLAALNFSNVCLDMQPG